MQASNHGPMPRLRHGRRDGFGSLKADPGCDASGAARAQPSIFENIARCCCAAFFPAASIDRKRRGAWRGPAQTRRGARAAKSASSAGKRLKGRGATPGPNPTRVGRRLTPESTPKRPRVDRELTRTPNRPRIGTESPAHPPQADRIKKRTPRSKHKKKSDAPTY